jgi:hypothetical protein
VADYYKGKGGRKIGRQTNRGAFVVDPARVPVIAVPDFLSCRLTPYVALNTPLVKRAPPTELPAVAAAISAQKAARQVSERESRVAKRRMREEERRVRLVYGHVLNGPPPDAPWAREALARLQPPLGRQHLRERRRPPRGTPVRLRNTWGVSYGVDDVAAIVRAQGGGGGDDAAATPARAE